MSIPSKQHLKFHSTLSAELVLSFAIAWKRSSSISSITSIIWRPCNSTQLMFHVRSDWQGSAMETGCCGLSG